MEGNHTSVFDFIKYYVSFKKPEYYLKFEGAISPIKNAKDMTLREMIIEDVLQEAMEKGIKKAE